MALFQENIRLKSHYLHEKEEKKLQKFNQITKSKDKIVIINNCWWISTVSQSINTDIENYIVIQPTFWVNINIPEEKCITKTLFKEIPAKLLIFP